MKLSLLFKFKSRVKIFAVKFVDKDIIINFDGGLGTIRLPQVHIEIDGYEVYIKREQSAPKEFCIRYRDKKIIVIDEVYNKKEAFPPNAKYSFILNGCRITYEPPPCSTKTDWGAIEIEEVV